MTGSLEGHGRYRHEKDADGSEGGDVVRYSTYFGFDGTRLSGVSSLSMSKISANGIRVPLAQRITIGVELESYTIRLPEYSIGRELAFPRKGVRESGERFARDASIGTEYNSQPFSTIREGLFLLKGGLRKYNRSHYQRKSRSKKGHQLLLVGGWRDRFAGTHIHISLADREINKEEAKSLASYLHDHIPFLLAMGANSPIRDDEITQIASNRVLRASHKYFRPVKRGVLTSRLYDEMTYNKGRVRKPGTLEIRILDSNVPEFVMACVCMAKAVTMAWLVRKKAVNKISHQDYLKARINAAKNGMKAKLCWNKKWISAGKYLDYFVWSFRDELRVMDIPHEIWVTLKLLKNGWNGSAFLSKAADLAYQEHPQTWQRRFAKRYASGLDVLLRGNSLADFGKGMGMDVRPKRGTWLGRKSLKLS